MAESTTKKVLKYGVPAALAISAATYFVSQATWTRPFFRPQGLGVRAALTSPGRPLAAVRVNPLPSQAGIPAAVSVPAMQLSQPGVVAAVSASISLGTASPGEVPRRTELVLAASTVGTVPAQPALSVLTSTVGGETSRPGLSVGSAAQGVPAATGSSLAVQGSGAGSMPAQTTLSVATSTIGKEGTASVLSVNPSQPGSEVAAFADRARPQMSTLDYPRSEAIKEGGECVYRLLTLARDARWGELGLEIERYGGDPKSVTVEVPTSGASFPDAKFEFAGVFHPSDDPQVLADQLKSFRYPEFGAPIVAVTGLSGDWHRVYDMTFDAFKDSDKPLIGLCIGQMTIGELLRIPEFLRIYAGRSAGVIANFDLTSANFVRNPQPAAVRAAMIRVGLTLYLVRRATPSAFVWLATGFSSNPSWQEWVTAQDKQTYSAIALTGPSASLACMHPKVAESIVKKFKDELGDMPVGLLGLTQPFYNDSIKNNDVHALEDYKALRRDLLARGFIIIHISEGQR